MDPVNNSRKSDAERNGNRQSAIDTRPLGLLALAVSVIGFLLSLTYFLSPLAYLASVVGVPLGLIARKEESTRRNGTIAVAISLIGCLVATYLLFRG